MIVTGPEVVQWVCDGTCGVPHSGLVAIGYVDSTGELIAALTFENYSGSNVFGHQRIAKNPPRGFWRSISSYLFDQLKVKRVTAVLDEANTKSVHLVQRMGFKQESIMKGAAPEDRDYIVFAMWEKDCLFRHW